jgi:hypothetical protein
MKLQQYQVVAMMLRDKDFPIKTEYRIDLTPVGLSDSPVTTLEVTEKQFDQYHVGQYVGLPARKHDFIIQED